MQTGTLQTKNAKHGSKEYLNKLVRVKSNAAESQHGLLRQLRLRCRYFHSGKQPQTKSLAICEWLCEAAAGKGTQHRKRYANLMPEVQMCAVPPGMDRVFLMVRVGLGRRHHNRHLHRRFLIRGCGVRACLLHLGNEFLLARTCFSHDTLALTFLVYTIRWGLLSSEDFPGSLLCHGRDIDWWDPVPLEFMSSLTMGACAEAERL